MTILLLRPAAKLASSCEYIRQHGIDCVGVALIETKVVPQAVEAAWQRLAHHSGKALAIFTSTVAAQAMLIPEQHWPSNILCLAVGNSTASVLNKHGIDVIVPDVETSEGLLALETLRELKSSSVFLIKGEDGLNILAPTLIDRGARVTEFAVYRRLILAVPKTIGAWQPEQIRCIVATSGEILHAAFQQFEHQWLKSLPWIVVSRRLSEIAAKLGISNCIVSQGASDAQITATIKSHWSAK